jgi:hypothetical protein
LLAVAAVLALGVGTLLRRSAGAVTAVIAGIVLPYLLAVLPGVLPGRRRGMAGPRDPGRSVRIAADRSALSAGP